MSSVEDIKKAIDEAKKGPLFNYTLDLTKMLNESIKENRLEQFGMVISEIAKLHHEKKYHQNINWNTIFINCINSNEAHFLKILNTGEIEDLSDPTKIKIDTEDTALPELKSLYFLKGNDRLEKNSVIYDNCSRFYGTNQRLIKHIENCIKCKKLKLSKKINIQNGDILDYLLKYTNSSLTCFKDNLKPTKSVLTYIKDEAVNILIYKELLTHLFSFSSWSLEQKLEIGDQLEIIHDFYESNSDEAIKFTDYLIDKGHIDLIKLFSDSAQLEDLGTMVSYSIRHEKYDLCQYFLKIFKDESKTKKVLDMINKLGHHINNLKSFKIYQEELGDFIKPDTYNFILNKESGKTNQDLEFIMELTKYDCIQNNFVDVDITSSTSDDEMTDIYQSFREEIEGNNTNSEEIETITISSIGDITPYDKSSILEPENLSFKMDSKIKDYVTKSLNKIAISL